MNKAGYTRVAVAAGDGIGPEIMQATMAILQASGAKLEYVPIEVGLAAYNSGHKAGIAPQAWEQLASCPVMLKAPIATPQGGGFKSLNVTIRKRYGLYANIRHCYALAPFVPTRHPNMNLVIVRENEEDLYAGIEHQQTPQVTQCLKLMSHDGSERLIRYGFALAQCLGRKRVTCMTKDNIMKLTDGMFHQTFQNVAKEYPGITADHYIIDIGAARLADTPERFDVIVTPNLYGDIISDVAAQIAGSVGMATSINLGAQFAMFEAIHGTAPDIAGKNIANPSGLLQSAVQMLAHIGQTETAAMIHNAWLAAIESGLHTKDIASDLQTRKVVSTAEFADNVIVHFGRSPAKLPVAALTERLPNAAVALPERKNPRKKLVGVDIFIQADPKQVDATITKLMSTPFSLKLQNVTSRGLEFWPSRSSQPANDHWRLRFVHEKQEGEKVEALTCIGTQELLVQQGFEVVKTENLYFFDDRPGYLRSESGG
jgi:isocitrate dehydrogenase